MPVVTKLSPTKLTAIIEQGEQQFVAVCPKKHEIWRKILPDGTILVVRVSHQDGRDIDASLLHRMLRQAGLTKDEFDRLLKG